MHTRTPAPLEPPQAHSDVSSKGRLGGSVMAAARSARRLYEGSGPVVSGTARSYPCCCAAPNPASVRSTVAVSDRRGGKGGHRGGGQDHARADGGRQALARQAGGRRRRGACVHVL